MPLMEFMLKKQSIIGIQAHLRKFLCKTRYKKVAQTSKILCNYNKD